MEDDELVYSEFLNDASRAYFHPSKECSLHSLVQGLTEEDAKDFLEKAFTELFEFKAEVQRTLEHLNNHEFIHKSD
jgi:hypothetical protein